MRLDNRWRHARRWYTQSYTGAHCRPGYNVHTCSHLLLYHRELCINQMLAQHIHHASRDLGMSAFDQILRTDVSVSFTDHSGRERIDQTVAQIHCARIHTEYLFYSHGHARRDFL